MFSLRHALYIIIIRPLRFAQERAAVRRYQSAGRCTPVSERRKDCTTKRHPERGISGGSAAVFVGTGVYVGF